MFLPIPIAIYLIQIALIFTLNPKLSVRDRLIRAFLVVGITAVGFEWVLMND